MTASTEQQTTKGKKRSPEAIAKMKATWAKKRAAKLNGHGETSAPMPIVNNARDAQTYLRHALERWPKEKGRGIARLYVELALATLEGKA